MRNYQSRSGGWNPYFAGALVGVVATLSAYLTTISLSKTNYLGASTTFVRIAGILEATVAEEHVRANEYFTKEKVRVDWQFMLVAAILIGSFIASMLDRSFKLEAVPPIWRERFGDSVPKRASFAFLGGVIAMIGARMADGCPSGHGLSGVMQLSLSGFVALAMFFATGALVAKLIYRGRSA